MNKKISVGLSLSLIILAVTATFALTMVFSRQIYNRIISNISQRSHTYEAAEEINKIISNNFYGDLREYNNNLGSYLAEGYVKSLNDPNSVYMNASEYAEYNALLEQGQTGVGIDTAYDYTDGRLKITRVYAGSPAEAEGLQVGDVITAVNNEAVNRSSFVLLQKSFYGSKLQTVKIEYLRNDETKTAEPMLGFVIPSVTGSVEGTVGYARITRFYKNTADELRSVLENFKSLDAEGVVIDLRSTSEGTIKYAADALDVILPGSADCIALAKYNNDEVTTFTPESSSFNFNFAVLIDSQTSGPAELFAADMRALKQAQLIGTVTAGVGTMQSVYNLDNGGALLLTVALIIPAGDESFVYDGVGISPTIEVESDYSQSVLLDSAQDAPLRKAFSLLAQ
ncbi:MAG: PDZ domain-containing protein [Clostridia bacterium]|nr:PDZ domain-containing protein [Clostridia bacterium]